MSKTDLAVSPRQTVPKKYPRAPGDIPPPHKSAHNKILCTDSNGKQASKTSTAEAFPLPPFCYALPVLLFLAFCIARTGRKKNRIHKTPSNTNTSAETKEESKARSNKTQRKQSKSEKSEASKQTHTNKKADRAIILKYQNKQRDKQL